MVLLEQIKREYLRCIPSTKNMIGTVIANPAKKAELQEQLLDLQEHEAMVTETIADIYAILNGGLSDPSSVAALEASAGQLMDTAKELGELGGE